MRTIKTLIPTVALIVFAITNMSKALADGNVSLTQRQQALVPIAAFAGTGDIAKLEAALEQGMEAGLSVNEVKEILVHTYAYAGFPRALNAINAYQTVLDQRQARGITDRLGKAATAVPADFDKTAYGHQVRNQLVGRDISNRTSGYPVFTPVIDLFLVEHLFADVFYRDVLSYQDRELVTISILAAMTGTEAQLGAHFNVSLNVGISPEQLQGFVEVLNQKVGVAPASRAAKVLDARLGIKPNTRLNQAVQVSKNQAPTPVPADYFTGAATIESRFAATETDRYRGAIVNFAAGARTAWHTHPLGQTLVVVSGRGLVKSEGSAAQAMRPGDVVWIPAHTRHWHGAAPDSPVSHVAISAPEQGMTVNWMEQVSDADYGN